MNERGMFYLLELGIGIVLVLALIQAIPADPDPANREAQIRLCHDLASVWTYDQELIEPTIARMGLAGRITINPLDGGAGESYACHATRMKHGMREDLTIRIG